MADEVLPQLNDPLVWDMAARNHVPHEDWVIIASGSGRNATSSLKSLACRECGQPWPCATKRAMDDMDEPSHFRRKST